MFGHQTFIECSKTKIEVHVTQLEKFVQTTKKVEFDKLEVQLQLFTEKHGIPKMEKLEVVRANKES
jgi:hypothetical protein